MSEGILHRLRRALAPAAGDRESPSHGVRLIVGLGNPGSEYAANRHNVGFWLVNGLARRHGIELKTGGQTALGSGAIGGREVSLAKPRTFVNNSGKAVRNLIDRLKLDGAQQLLVVWDDLDLPVGKLRLRSSGGSGGQKGPQSIIDATGSEAFPRIRIGIGRPSVGGEPSWDPEVIAGYVLSDPPPDERDLLDQAVERAIEAVEAVLAEGIERAMAQYN